MNQIQQMLALIDQFATAKGISTSRVTTIVFNSGAMYERLRSGSDITVGRLERAMQWFSDNWPDDLAWPEGIVRPTPKPVIAAAE